MANGSRAKDEAHSRGAILNALSAQLDSLYRLARYLTQSASAAEDLVQETCARALANQNKFEPGTNAVAWLVSILRNTFIDQERRRRRAPFVRADVAASEASTELVGDDTQHSPMRTLIAAEIEAALSSLSEEHRTIILLDLEGFTEPEIARILECAPGTVKSRLFRARSLLRSKLREYSK